MHQLWHFIVANQTALNWLGGIGVTITGSACAVIKFFLNRKQPPPSVSAPHGVAIVGDVNQSPITVMNMPKPSDGSGN